MKSVKNISKKYQPVNDYYVTSEIKNNAGVISIYNKNANSLNSQMLDAFEKEINYLSGEDISCIVIKSDYDDVFSSGACFKELLSSGDFIAAENFFFRFPRVINTMRKSSKIIITLVDGKTVGGGLGLVCVSDYSLATISSKVKLSEISIGIGPFIIQPVLERKIGKSAFSELALCPKEWKDAKWAYDRGIFNKIFEDKDSLEKYTDKMIEDFSSYSKNALSELKKNLWEDYDNWEDILYKKAGISAKLSISEEARKILSSFSKC